MLSMQFTMPCVSVSSSVGIVALHSVTFKWRAITEVDDVFVIIHCKVTVGAVVASVDCVVLKAVGQVSHKATR